jgi:GH24 family phage-related lysozyme (muramidase)
MSEEDIEIEDSTNLTSDEDVNTEEVEETVVETETEDDPSELIEKNKRLYERAKKAEAEAKSFRAQLAAKEPTPTPSGNGSLTIRDLAAIKDLEADDAEWLANYASKMGLNLSDARKDKDAKAVLSVRAEERRTAAATATGAARRGTSRVSDETLLEKANRGDIGDDDTDAMRRIAEARFKAKKKA